MGSFRDLFTSQRESLIGKTINCEAEDPSKSINKTFEELSPDVRPVVKLCFCTLGIIFTELDVQKCKELDQQLTNNDHTVSSSNIVNISTTDNNDLQYTPIPSIPFGAVRILWQELLNIHNEDEISTST